MSPWAQTCASRASVDNRAELLGQAPYQIDRTMLNWSMYRGAIAYLWLGHAWGACRRVLEDDGEPESRSSRA